MAEERHGPLAPEGWLLAIESATGAASAALWRGGETRDEEAAAPGDSAAAALLPAIDRLLRRARVGAGELAGFAIAIGPGSFTGLRIGVATLKGLAFGSPLPVAAVSTLAALARAAGAGPDPVLALLDARRGEVYAGAFRREGEQPDALLPEGVYTPEQLAARLPARCRLVGEGAPLVLAPLRAALGAGVTLASASGLRARQVAELGAGLLARGAGIPAAVLVPRYLRRAEAEVRRTGERFEAAAEEAGGPLGASFDGPDSVA
ncbi:MAG TPA: tRNA (adenosine(37)-N6)-threonylcarbamoyltransferase complex dimerization subunit type 1 TsaB [Myxococcota bacterium]